MRTSRHWAFEITPPKHTHIRTVQGSGGSRRQATASPALTPLEGLVMTAPFTLMRPAFMLAWILARLASGSRLARMASRRGLLCAGAVVKCQVRGVAVLCTLAWLVLGELHVGACISKRASMPPPSIQACHTLR